MNREKGRAGARKALLRAGVFAGVLAALYLLTVLIAAIPNDAIWANMQQSALYELTVDRFSLPENGSFHQMADNHADRISLNIGWQMGKGNPFRAALDTGYYDGGRLGDAAGLYHAVSRGEDANKSYNRYWHGGAVLLRLLHLWTDIQGAKVLALAALLILIVLTLGTLCRRGHWDLAGCLLISLLCVRFLAVGGSFEYLPCFLVCFSLCPAFLLLERRGDEPLALLSVAAGVLTAYFDFLTTETMTVLLPLILVVAMRSKEGRLGGNAAAARLILNCLVCWGLSYGGAFLVKWAAASLVCGQGQMLDALSAAAGRVNGTVVVNGVERNAGPLLGIGANLSVLFGGNSRTNFRIVAAGLILCAAAGYVLCRLRRLTPARGKAREGTWWMLFLGALVLARYALLANHAYQHAFFTYRALVSTVLAVLAATALNFRPQKKGSSHDGTDHLDALPQ